MALDRLPGARVLSVLGVCVSLLCKSLVVMETQAVSLSLALATGLGQGRDTVVEGAGGRGELGPGLLGERRVSWEMSSHLPLRAWSGPDLEHPQGV